MNNITMIYNATINKAEIIITNLKSIGVNITDFESELKEIKIKVESSITNLDSTGYSQENNINSIYQNGTNKTKQILDDLEKYQQYYKTINECYYVQGTQDMTEFSIEELGSAVTNLIGLLKYIKEFNGVTGSNLSEVDSLYDVVYELIKMEYEHKGSSELFNYCRQSEIDSINVSKSIVNELNSLREGKYDTSKIELLMSKINSNNTSNLYLDEELIRTINSIVFKDNHLETLKKALIKLSNEVDEKVMKLGSLIRSKDNIMSDRYGRLSDSISSKKRRNKAIVKNSLSIGLTLLTLFGIQFGISRATKGTECMTDVQTYSTATGKTVSSKEYVDKIGEINGEKVEDVVIIQHNDPWVRTIDEDNNVIYQRVVEKTTIAGIEYNDLSKYLDLNLDELTGTYEYDAYVETTTSLTAEDKYEEGYYDVIKEHQYTEDSRVGVLDIKETMIVGVIHTIVSIFATVFIILNSTLRDKGIINRLKKLIRDLSEITSDNKSIKDGLEKIASINKSLEEILNENAEFKRRYLEIIHNPEYSSILRESDVDYLFIEEKIDRNESRATLSLKNNA